MILPGKVAEAGLSDYPVGTILNKYAVTVRAKTIVLNHQQISDDLKNELPDHVKEKAREMAQEELQRRLEELNMSASDAKGYGQLLVAVDAHIGSLHDLLERMSMFLVTRKACYLVLTRTSQTWRRRKRSVFGSRGRLKES